MPRYFFHLHDGVSIPDKDGIELASWADAQSEAIRIAGGVIADSAKTIALGEDWSMTVTNEGGLTLFRLNFYVAHAPVLSGRNERT